MEVILKDNELIWLGHVQRMGNNRIPRHMKQNFMVTEREKGNGWNR